MIETGERIRIESQRINARNRSACVLERVIGREHDALWPQRLESKAQCRPPIHAARRNREMIAEDLARRARERLRTGTATAPGSIVGVDAVEEERYAFAHVADDDPELRQLVENTAE